MRLEYRNHFRVQDHETLVAVQQELAWVKKALSRLAKEVSLEDRRESYDRFFESLAWSPNEKNQSPYIPTSMDLKVGLVDSLRARHSKLEQILADYSGVDWLRSAQTFGGSAYTPPATLMMSRGRSLRQRTQSDSFRLVLQTRHS